MARIMNPEGVHQPLGTYHHCAAVDPGAAWLCMAGQVGVDPDGNVEQGFRAQAERAFRNVLAGLEANGFGPEDLVKLTVYILDRADLAEMREVRTAVLGADCQPPSTLIIVAGLAAPEMLIEVDATAARG